MDELFLIEQCKPSSPLQMVKQWSPVSEVESSAEVDAEMARLKAYDEYYSLSGWQYRFKVKKRKAR